MKGGDYKLILELKYHDQRKFSSNSDRTALKKVSTQF